jgi:hypothetical protein
MGLLVAVVASHHGQALTAQRMKTVENRYFAQRMLMGSM